VKILVTVEGTVDEIIYTNESNGYTVCEIVNDKESITIVGYMPFINKGELLKVTGRWVMHPDYGRQLKAELYEKVLPKTTDAIEKYLASGLIKGIGPVTASKITQKFGEDTLNIIQSNPEKLAEIKGISLQKALAIGQAYNEQKELRSVIMFFQNYGISPAFAAKIYKVFGDNTIDEIKKNPYKLADEMFGIGFKTADRIAMSLGIEKASKYRLCSGIKYTLMKASTNGHTFVPKTILREHASALLDVNTENIDDALITLRMDDSIHIEKHDNEERVYLNYYYNAEIYVSRKLIELASVRFNTDDGILDRYIEEFQQQEGIYLEDMQKEAVKESLTNGVLVITGGPGTGKTTVIKSIINLFSRLGHEVMLAAPTGRAAKRMSEATGYEAKTIHRLLEIGYTGDEEELVFAKDENNPINADAVIIDEMSMVDILLMNNLLKAIIPGTRLVLVGDVNQLPSVGAGNVLKDIISSNAVKTVKLSKIFRQAQESMIIVNAHRINNGEYPYINRKDKDFFFLQRNTPEDIVRTIVDLCNKRLPQTYGYDPMKHIQVLSATKKGDTGVLNLNIELQKVLNKNTEGGNEKASYGFTFKEGDRVMQTKNNYNLKWIKADDSSTEGIGIFNGDVGIIEKIDNDERILKVLFDDDKIVEYDYSMLDEIEPAYAITIHKSQGSEFPVVIIPLYFGPQVLLTRNLLYTAVTRAKDLVVLVGIESVLKDMVNNMRETLRYSALSEKLINTQCIIGDV